MEEVKRGNDEREKGKEGEGRRGGGGMNKGGGSGEGGKRVKEWESRGKVEGGGGKAGRQGRGRIVHLL